MSATTTTTSTTTSTTTTTTTTTTPAPTTTTTTTLAPTTTATTTASGPTTTAQGKWSIDAGTMLDVLRLYMQSCSTCSMTSSHVHSQWIQVWLSTISDKIHERDLYAVCSLFALMIQLTLWLKLCLDSFPLTYLQSLMFCPTKDVFVSFSCFWLYSKREELPLPSSHMDIACPTFVEINKLGPPGHVVTVCDKFRDQLLLR